MARDRSGLSPLYRGLVVADVLGGGGVPCVCGLQAVVVLDDLLRLLPGLLGCWRLDLLQPACDMRTAPGLQLQRSGLPSGSSALHSQAGSSR